MSITLAAADTIAGVAGSATAITYTITGDEIAASDTFKVLAQGQLPNAIATIYTVPASTATIVKTIHLVNTTAGTVTASLTVKGTAAANQILPPISILAGGFAVFGDDGWQVYNSSGQILSVGSTGAAGAAGANGLATSGTPAVVLSTTAAAGVAATALATDAQIIAFDITVPTGVAAAAATGSAAVTARRDHVHSGLGLPLGLTGAVSATRYVGGTATVAPTTGTFAIGDYVITQSGTMYICTVAGTPGTWVAVSGGASFATPAIVLGTAAAAGVAATVIRSDATIVAFDVTVPVTQAYSDAAATGAAAVAARRDHVHGMPAAGGATYAVPAIVLGTAAAAGVAGTGIRSDATVIAFDTTAPVTQAYSDAAAVGTAAVAARRDHKHGMPAAGGAASPLAFVYLATIAR